jgi:membrane-associated phospholipid phosphatase
MKHFVSFLAIIIKMISFQKAAAYFFSVLFNPFLLLPFFQLYVFKALGISFFSNAFMYVILFQMLVPITVIAYFIKVKKISDLELTKREERILYFFILCVSFFLALFTTRLVSALNFVNILLFFIIFSIAIITTKWKISGHIGMDTTMILGLSMLNPSFLYGLIIIPFVAWSRIYLKKHDIYQVSSGFVLALVVFLIIKFFVPFSMN